MVFRHKPRWRAFLAVAAILALLSGGGVVWVQLVAERRWNEMRREAHQLLQQEHRRPTARPVLRGTAVPGNSIDDYEPALESLRSMEGSFTLEGFYNWSPRLSRIKPVSRARVEPIVTLYEPALTRFRAGTRRAEAWLHVRGPDGGRIRGLTGLANPVRRLGMLAAVKARFLSDDGKGREAAELLLDLGQLGRDFTCAVIERGGFVTDPTLDVCVAELRPLVLSNRLSGDDLLQVVRELEILDRSLRTYVPVEAVDLMEFGLELFETPDLSGTLRSEFTFRDEMKPWQSWRFGFSARLMVVDAFDEGKVYVRKCDGLRSAPWAEVRRMADVLEAVTGRHPNPVVRIHLWGLVNLPEHSFALRARLRLLRMAAHHRATGEFLELEDPFGLRLRWREDGCRYKLWSVGPDGVDNGGDDTRDIVIEMDR